MKKLIFIILLSICSTANADGLFTVHTTRTEITGWTKNNTWQTVNLSSFLIDSSAVGVLIEMENQTLAKRNAGGRATTDSMGAAGNLGSWSYSTIYIGFPAASKNVSLIAQDATIHFYIRAEFTEDTVFASNSGSASQSFILVDGQVNTWRDRTVSVKGGDSVSDVEAVIVQVRKTNTATKWGIREKGSTDGFVTMNGLEGVITGHIIGVNDSGQYQTYEGGKDATPDVQWAWYTEIGYIKKGNYVAYTDPTNMNQPGYGFPVFMDISDTDTEVPIDNFYFVLRFNNTVVTHYISYCRPWGSADPPNFMQAPAMGRWQTIGWVTGAGTFSRSTPIHLFNANVDVYVMGYAKSSGAKVVLRGKKTEVKGRKIKVQ